VAKKKAKGKSKTKFSVKALVASLDGPKDRLGNARAVTIVCHCGNTVPGNLARKLGDLGINGIPYQKCVFEQVDAAGFVIDIDDIPNGSSTRLIDTVNAIQNAPAQ
jgi:hypothetical protein